MAAPAFRSISSTSYASRTNTVVTAPTGIANNDILLAVIFAGANGSAPAVTPPAGFTLIGTPTGATDTAFFAQFSVYWKRAASENGSYTFTHSVGSSQAFIIAISGAITTGSPIDAFSSNTGINAASSATSVTTTAADALVCYLAHDWEGTGALSPPTGMTERFDGLIYAADVAQATAGATGNKTQTNANGTSAGFPWAAWLVALKAATGGGSTTNQTVNITSAVTVAATKQARKIASITAAITVAASRAIAATRAITSSVAVTAVRQARKTVNIASTVTVAATAIRVFLKTVNITSAVTVSAVRQARKTSSIAITAAITSAKQARKAISINITAAVTAVATRAFLLTVNIAAAVSVTSTRQARKIVNVASTTATNVRRAMSVARSITATSSVLAVKQVRKTLAVSVLSLVAVIAGGAAPVFAWTKRVFVTLFDNRKASTTQETRTFATIAESRTFTTVEETRTTDAEGI